MEQGLPGQLRRKPGFLLHQQQAAALLPRLLSTVDRQPFASRHPAFSSTQLYRQARYLPGSQERIQAHSKEQGLISQLRRKPGVFLRQQQAAVLPPNLVSEDQQ